MKPDQCQYAESTEILKLLDRASYMTTSRETVFRAWLTMSVAALAGQTMEEEYLAAIKPYCDGARGSRPVDYMAQAFAVLQQSTLRVHDDGKIIDVLGDIFQGGITRGENGQFFTPMELCRMMATMNLSAESETPIRTVNDPCCGSGRMLLAVAEAEPHRLLMTRTFDGQDVDIRCVMMTALNFAFYGLRGTVRWGDSLRNEVNRMFIVDTRGAIAAGHMGFIRSWVPSASATVNEAPVNILPDGPTQAPAKKQTQQPTLF